MKVAFVTGPCPPAECGVGDYTACLGKALQICGSETQVITAGDWNLLGALAVSRRLRQQKFDIVHIEYPTVGFGYKLGPQALSLLRSSVLTIHEASQRRILRKLALYPFAIRPEHVIFTVALSAGLRRAGLLGSLKSVPSFPLEATFRWRPERVNGLLMKLYISD